MTQPTQSEETPVVTGAEPTPSTLTLADGRTLAWYEFGDPAGVPCLSSSGTPASGLFGVLYDDLARAAGVRWISVDKPGYGHSTIDPHRSLARYVDDIRQLIDHLALDRIAMYGESGGGPHVLALAHGLPDRITTAIVASGLGPGNEPWVRQGMTPANRFLFWSARHAPWLTRANMALTGRAICAPQRRASLEKFMKRQAPSVDRAVMQQHPELMDAIHQSGVDAFRQGSRGAAQEFEIFAQPWHFRLEDIHVPVELWHGTADRNVPVATALEVARRVPNCVSHIIEDAGHLMVMDHREAILEAVLNAAPGLKLTPDAPAQ